jgi:predicted acetyltransferase
MSDREYVDEPQDFEYEVYEKLTREVLEQIVAFIKGEKEKWQVQPPEIRREEKYFDHMNSFVLSANNTLDQVKLRGDLEKSLAVFCRKGDRVVGVSFVGVTSENKVPGDVFFGVAYDQIKRGIATELVRKTHEALSAKGIEEYKVTVWEASRKAIEKVLGRKLTELDPNSMGGKTFIVKL